MSNLIKMIATWLTTTHSISLDGWVWILMIPITCGLIVVVGGYLVMAVGSVVTKGIWR